MDIVNIIDKLDALLYTSRKLPGTSSRIVDSEKVMELVEQLRLSIPQDVKSAQEVLDRKDSILSQAQISVRKMKDAAEDEYSARVNQSEILNAAKAKSEGIIEDANWQSQRILERATSDARQSRTEVDEYIIDSLRNLDRELTSVLGTVKRSLDTLSSPITTAA